MTRTTQHTLVFVATSVFSAGVIGWLMWKLGALDIILGLIIQLAMLFPVAFVLMGVLNPDTYNTMVDRLNETIDLINVAATKAVAKGKDLSTVTVDLNEADASI